MNYKNNIPQPAEDKKASENKSTDADTKVKTIDGKNAGSVGAVNDSDTETRKNVNGDPNIIQGNKLNEEDNSDPEVDEQ